jgi:hypothetical protein
MACAAAARFRFDLLFFAINTASFSRSNSVKHSWGKIIAVAQSESFCDSVTPFAC